MYNKEVIFTSSKRMDIPRIKVQDSGVGSIIKGRILSSGDFDCIEKGGLFDLLDSIPVVKRVHIVGSSGAGKSFLVNCLRDQNGKSPTVLIPDFGKEKELTFLEIPKRYTTRESRDDKDGGTQSIENINVSEHDFKDFVEKGKIGTYRVRNLSEKSVQKKIRYGFEHHWSDKDTILEQLYENLRRLFHNRSEGFKFIKTNMAAMSSNNALAKNPKEVINLGPIDRTIVIGVIADDEERAQRIAERSPDLVKNDAKQVQERLSDTAESIRPYCHLVIKNGGEHKEKSPTQLKQLLRWIHQMGDVLYH